MEEGNVSIEGETRALPDPFLVLATENPIELEGTFALPEAQLDRFLVRIRLGYPSRSDEAGIARRYQAQTDPLDSVGRVDAPASMIEMREAARTVHVSTPVEGYIVDLVRATRARADVRLGGSPRATVALYRAAQAAAYLDGRDFVAPDDVKALVPAVLAHRILLDIDRQLRGATAEDVIEAILHDVAVPPIEETAAEVGG
jgi:MoxR-like ATPase